MKGFHKYKAGGTNNICNTTYTIDTNLDVSTIGIVGDSDYNGGKPKLADYEETCASASDCSAEEDAGKDKIPRTNEETCCLGDNYVDETAESDMASTATQEDIQSCNNVEETVDIESKDLGPSEDNSEAIKGGYANKLQDDELEDTHQTAGNSGEMLETEYAGIDDTGGNTTGMVENVDEDMDETGCNSKRMAENADANIAETADNSSTFVNVTNENLLSHCGVKNKMVDPGQGKCQYTWWK